MESKDACAEFDANLRGIQKDFENAMIAMKIDTQLKNAWRNLHISVILTIVGNRELPPQYRLDPANTNKFARVRHAHELYWRANPLGDVSVVQYY